MCFPEPNIMVLPQINTQLSKTLNKIFTIGIIIHLSVNKTLPRT